MSTSNELFTKLLDTKHVSQNCILAYDDLNKVFYGSGRISSNLYKFTTIIEKISHKWYQQSDEKIINQLNSIKSLLIDSLSHDFKNFKQKISKTEDLTTVLVEIRRDLDECLIHLNNFKTNLQPCKNYDQFKNELESLDIAINQEVNKIKEELEMYDLVRVIKISGFLGSLLDSEKIFSDFNMKTQIKVITNLPKINKILNERLGDICKYYFSTFIDLTLKWIILNYFRSLLVKISPNPDNHNNNKDNEPNEESPFDLNSFTEFLQNLKNDLKLITDQQNIEKMFESIDKQILIIKEQLLNQDEKQKLLTAIRFPKSDDSPDYKLLDDLKRYYNDDELNRAFYDYYSNRKAGLIGKDGFIRPYTWLNVDIELVQPDLIVPYEVIKLLERLLLEGDTTIKTKSYISQIRVFSIKEIEVAKKFIFKISSDHEQLVERYKKIVYAKYVCEQYNLNYLVVPKACLLKIGNRLLLVEEFLDFEDGQEKQEELYTIMTQVLRQAVIQLATFISITGLNDVVWRNIPILNDSLKIKSMNGNESVMFIGKYQLVKIGIIDPDEMDGVEAGLFGGAWGRTGLVGCVDPSFAEDILAEAIKHSCIHEGILRDGYVRAKERRIKYLKEKKVNKNKLNKS